MAGGKQTPRQRMINLMYLVFIAMLALNMSKEVLAAFGLMEVRTSENNAKLEASTNSLMGQFERNSKKENNAEFGENFKKAVQVQKLAKDYYDYIEGIKTDMMGTIKEKDRERYEVMDKGDFLDQKFFVGDKLKPDGEEFLSKIKSFKTEIAKFTTDAVTIEAIESRFNTGDENSQVAILTRRLRLIEFKLSLRRFPIGHPSLNYLIYSRTF